MMGIVKLALIVLAMVSPPPRCPSAISSAPTRCIGSRRGSMIFYLVASDYFQVVRLKGFVEFWKMYRGIANQPASLIPLLRGLPHPSNTLALSVPFFFAIGSSVG